MAHFRILNKLIRLMKATMEDSTYYVKIGTIITDGFKVGNRWRWTGAQSL
jgi:hypothetical protein